LAARGAFAFELNLPLELDLTFSLAVPGTLLAFEARRRPSFGGRILVVQHAPPGVVRPPGRARSIPIRILVVEVAAPAHPSMLVEVSVPVQYRRPVSPPSQLQYVDAMRYLEAGGVRLSVVGLGTWQFGSAEWGYGRAFAQGEAIRITQRALDLGINLIDTAEIYGFGRSERVIGRAIAGRSNDAFVATKLLPVAPFDPVVRQRALASARRLGVDRIDLYQAHWPHPVLPPRPLFDALGQLQRDGVVGHIGVSNYSLEEWQSAERMLGGPVLSNQVEYSLVERGPEQQLLGWAQGHDRIIIAYSPLAQGFLSDCYSSTKRPRRMRSMRALFLPENLDLAAELLRALRDIATKYDATPAQVALAWLIRHPNVVVIPGASSVAQLESNAAVADLELTVDDDARLIEASDQFHPITGLRAIPGLLKTHLPG
jgi:aryl-alcohol dehydrogenase-like predicted oxidoreductase